MESVLVLREFYVPVCLDMNILRLMDFKCVSYESICGIGYRVFAAFGKYFMGKGKSVCDYYNPFPYCFKSNSAIIIALPDLFYRRGIFCCLCDEYGDSWNCFFLVSWLPHGILYLAALALLLLVEPHRFYNRKIHGCCGWHGGWELRYWYFLDVYWRHLLESGCYVLL